MRAERLITAILLAPILPTGFCFSPEIRHRVREEQNNTCAMCGKEATQLQAHHRVPEHALAPDGIKGKNIRENAIGLCGEADNDCHEIADQMAIKKRLFWKDGEFVPISEIEPEVYIKTREERHEKKEKHKKHQKRYDLDPCDIYADLNFRRHITTF